MGYKKAKDVWLKLKMCGYWFFLHKLLRFYLTLCSIAAGWKVSVIIIFFPEIDDTSSSSSAPKCISVGKLCWLNVWFAIIVNLIIYILSTYSRKRYTYSATVLYVMLLAFSSDQLVHCQCILQMILFAANLRCPEIMCVFTNLQRLLKMCSVFLMGCRPKGRDLNRQQDSVISVESFSISALCRT